MAKQKKTATAMSPMQAMEAAKVSVEKSINALLQTYDKALKTVQQAQGKAKAKLAKQTDQLRVTRSKLKTLREEAKTKKGKTLLSRIEKLDTQLETLRAEIHDSKASLALLKADGQQITQSKKKSIVMKKAADKAGKAFQSAAAKPKAKRKSRQAVVNPSSESHPQEASTDA